LRNECGVTVITAERDDDIASDEGIVSMTLRFAITCVVLAFVAGCQTTGFESLKKATEKVTFVAKAEQVQESQYPQAEKLVTIWSDAVYTQPGQKPTRGFGGRLYFYNSDNNTVPVEGQLVVYAYDDSAPGNLATKPSRKFVFTPEQFTAHYTPSDLGASYSVWIPWDEVGGVRKSVSLLPVFTCTSGKIVMGQQSINVLQGKTPEVVEPPRGGHFTPLSSSGGQEVRPVAYEQSQRQDVASRRGQWDQSHTFVPSDPTRRRLRTTEIKVSPTMNKRLLQQRALEGVAVGRPKTDGQPARPLDADRTSGEQGHASSAPLPTSAEASATAESLPVLPEARFGHPRYLAPRGPDGQPVGVHALTPQRPAAPRPGHPSPPQTDHSPATAGF
jgi:hypothetical protein